MSLKKKVRAVDLAVCALCAAFFTICAYISIPFSAIPMTLQTFGICLVASVFGAKRSIISVLVYLLMGAVGIPVYSCFTGGVGILFGITGGYFIGFIFIALVVGLTSDKTKNKNWQSYLSMTAGLILCYAFGTAWYMLFYRKGASLQSVLTSCVVPFIPLDVLEVLLATVISKRLKKRLPNIIKK